MLKQKGRVVLGQTDIDGLQVVAPEDLAEAGLTSKASEMVPVRRVTLTLDSAVLTVTDGDTAGGYFGYKLADFGVRRAAVLACRAVMEIEAASAEITQTAADCELTVGTAQQDDGGTMADDDAESNLASDVWTVALVGGAAGPATKNGPYGLTPAYVAATDAIYLNLFIPDASVDGDGTLTVSLTLDLYILDLGGA